MVRQLNVMTWNVKGLNHPIKRKKVFTHLKQFNPDIVFLQETHLRSSDSSRFLAGWVGQHFHSTFEAKARGASILISTNVMFESTKVVADKNGRYIIVTGKLFNINVVLASVYAPNVEDAEFFTRLFALLPDLDSHYLILGTDLNRYLDQVQDRSTTRPGPVSTSVTYIKSFLSRCGISDVWRDLNPTGREYSFFSHVHRVYTRIDYLLMDKRLLPQVRSCAYQSIVVSDHAPLLMSLLLPGVPRPSRRWRFNSTLLADDDFVKYIQQEVTFFLATNNTPQVSGLMVWDALKAYLRGQIISFTARKKAQSERERLKLTAGIADIDRQYALQPTPELYNRRVELKAKFDILTTHQAQSLLLKSKSTFYEHGEKTGKLLADQLKARRTKQIITNIRTVGGEVTADTGLINSTFRDFYSNLYTSQTGRDELAISTFLDPLPIPTVAPDLVEKLERPITQAEVALAISSMQSGKSAGPDGFPVEFFKKFSALLSPQLSAVFAESLEQGTLPPSLGEACITLIAKKGKDPTECASYRPISLLNVDAKILAKVLSRRLEEVLPQIISPDQTGFIKDRYSFFNVRRLFDTLYQPSGAEPECVASLDAEKAFDRVEFEYLFAVLEKFGFGPTFVSWIKLLYKSPTATVQTNGVFSPTFALGRGTRQGCPLSPFLFDLAIEPLAVSLRCSNDVVGIRRGAREYKLSLYADDLLLYISNPSTSLPAVLALLDQFGHISGYKINPTKSILFPANEAASNLDYSHVPFRVEKNQFTYLGVTVTRKYEDLFLKNFVSLSSQIKTSLQQWSPLTMSLAGRINSIKMNILPKFTYLFQCIPVFIPKSFFTSLDSVISSYIWQNKKPRVSRALLKRAKSGGGMGLPDFRHYYWAANIRCLAFWNHFYLQPTRPEWTTLELESCGGLTLPALLSAPLGRPVPVLISNPVVRHTLRIWAQFRRAYNFNDLSLLSPTASNHLFVPSLRDLTFQNWHEKGIKWFKDLFIDGSFTSFDQLSQKYDLPRSHFYRFLQARHYVSSILPTFPAEPNPNPIDGFLSFDPTVKGAISILYDIISNLRSAPLDRIKADWERDLGLALSDETWDSILSSIHRSSLCARHCLIQFKVVHRAHISKAKLASIYPDMTPTCDKCKGNDADLFHQYWLCPQLQPFWRNVFNTLSNIIQRDLDPDPLVALLGTAGGDGLPLTRSESRMVDFALLMARRAVLLKWKDAAPPSNRQWLCDIMSCLKLEMLRFSIAGSETKFFKTWGPFMTFYHNTLTA